MKHYHVTTVIQSRDMSNLPVTVNWYQGNSEGQAIASLVSAAVEREESTTLPVSMQYTVLSVHLDITEEVNPCPVEGCTLAVTDVGGLAPGGVCPVHGHHV